jgi:hypothetical protein
MVRNVTASAQNLLDTLQGTELMALVYVEWSEGGGVYYSDQELNGALPYVLELGGFDGSMMLQGAGDSQELNLVLDDIDGHIRDIYNSMDIHKRPVSVYLLHKGLTFTDRILVFRGEIVTPIEWDEANRSVSFNVLSKLKEKQVGFSMEEGDFPNIPDEALGKPWPLVFGQVCHLPAVKVRAPRRGYLQSGVGIHDFTLEPRICQAVKIQCPSQSTGNQSTLEQGANNTWTGNVAKTIGPDLECVNRRFGEICKLKDLLEQQLAYEKTTLSIYNGVSFPQGKPVTIYVDAATFHGIFSGNSFAVIWQKHPEFDTFNHVACRNVPSFGYGTVLGLPQIGGTGCNSSGGYWQLGTNGGAAGQMASATWVSSSNGTIFIPNQSQEQAFQSCEAALVSTPGMVGGPKTSWEYYDQMEASDFFWAPPGSEVYMESESEILYVASLIPGTVDGVAAFRQAPNGFRYLTEVPSDRYTVYETDYQGYTVVEIGLEKELSKYIDSTTKESEGWEDQIYVSFTSSVGGNPVDVITWLVNKYTDLTIDATSFASVSSYLTNYPTNFYTTDRPDVMELINDIAYQSRCAVYVRNNVIFLKYLSLEPSSVRTLDKSDILFGSFKESISETEEIYTTHNVQWQKAGAAVRDDYDVEQKLVLKYNVDKYGTNEDEWTYQCLNHFDLVLKTGTFWLIRKANSWKMIEFDLPIKHLDLDVLDAVTVNLASFSSTPVKCVIESVSVNPDENKISLRCWTPIRAGETSPYFWAWPSQQSQYQIWPLPGDTHGGGGYTFEVTPPIGHLLRGGEHEDDQLIITSGDLHPSDLDDVAPTISCDLSDYLNFNEKPPEIVAKEIAQSSARQTTETQMSGGGNAGGGGDSKKTLDGCGVGNGCNYKVRVVWHKSAAQGQATALGGAKHGGPCGGPCRCVGGCPTCFGPQWVVCHTFGSASGACAAARYFKAAYSSEDGWWQCNQVGVLSAGASDGSHGADTEGGGGGCPSVGDCTGVKEDPKNEGGESLKEKGEAEGKTGEEPEDPAGLGVKTSYWDDLPSGGAT